MKKTIVFLFASLLCLNSFAGDGKIIFSKSPITVEVGETSFEVGNKIYCKLILETPLSEQQLYKYYQYEKKSDKKANGYYILAFIDDFKGSTKYETNNSWEISADLVAKNSFEFILAETNEFTFNPAVLTENQVKFKDVLNNLSLGKHKVKIVAFAQNGDDRSKKPIAVGEFELNKTQTGKVKIGMSFKDVVAKKSDPKIEASALKALQEYYKGSDKLATSTIKIIENEWRTDNHPSSGAILGRWIPAAVLVKNSNGDCEIVVKKLYQQYTGSGYQETIKLMGTAMINPPCYTGKADCE